MTLDFGDLSAGMRLSGVVAESDVTVAYLLYQRAHDRGWASEAGAYNGLITAWSNLRTGAATVAAAAAGPTQQTLL